LSTKAREEPYKLAISAVDNGNPTKSASTTVEVTIFSQLSDLGGVQILQPTVGYTLHVKEVQFDRYF